MTLMGMPTSHRIRHPYRSGAPMVDASQLMMM